MKHKGRCETDRVPLVISGAHLKSVTLQCTSNGLCTVNTHIPLQHVQNSNISTPAVSYMRSREGPYHMQACVAFSKSRFLAAHTLVSSTTLCLFKG
jgi:hypothetical protein